MNEAWRAEAHELISSFVEKTCEQYGAKASLEIVKGYPFLSNDPELTRSMQQITSDFFGATNVEELPIRLTSEDFSFYAQEIPVCFFRLGVRNEEKGIVHGVHHPKFDSDNQALLIGMQAMCLGAFR
jgi:metal-dependent amidase/aminoacylase/carboxypeptidase family protein